MMDNVNGIKAAIAAALAAMTAFWGWFGWLLCLWIGCMLLDYVTGSGAAAKNGIWTSKKAREGIWHKVGCIVAVTVAAAADMLIGTIIENLPGLTLPFSYTVFLCPLVVVWYILTELGSVAENAAAMGAPVPEFLKKILQKTKDAADEAGDKW
jgi:toxin secretion/phage lysis holin